MVFRHHWSWLTEKHCTSTPETGTTQNPCLLLRLCHSQGDSSSSHVQDWGEIFKGAKFTPLRQFVSVSGLLYEWQILIHEADGVGLNKQSAPVRVMLVCWIACLLFYYETLYSMLVCWITCLLFHYETLYSMVLSLMLMSLYEEWSDYPREWTYWCIIHSVSINSPVYCSWGSTLCCQLKLLFFSLVNHWLQTTKVQCGRRAWWGTLLLHWTFVVLNQWLTREKIMTSPLLWCRKCIELVFCF